MSACRGSTQITGGGDGGSRRPSRVPCLERDERAGAVDHLEIRKRVLQFAGDHCLHRFDPEPTATRKLPESVDDFATDRAQRILQRRDGRQDDRRSSNRRSMTAPSRSTARLIAS